jgi:hypothetical protein
MPKNIIMGIVANAEKYTIFIFFDWNLLIMLYWNIKDSISILRKGEKILLNHSGCGSGWNIRNLKISSVHQKHINLFFRVVPI